jgi:hypothetical protein
MSGIERPRPDEGAERRALHRLLRAAAADDDGSGLPDAFAARVAARALSAPPGAPVLALGTAAWRLLPALAALVLLVAAWTGYETIRLDAAQESTLAQAVGAGGGAAEAALTVLMLGGGADGSGGGQP